jgi:hypothetical protein
LSNIKYDLEEEKKDNLNEDEVEDEVEEEEAIRDYYEDVTDKV